jgi:hypothetical protein
MGLNLIDNNKYIFDIPIPFCHHLYLSATFKQCFTEFEGTELGFHIVYMWDPYQIPTCDLIGQFNQSTRMCGIHM